ncbi:uncharacterized protein LACBIDRAFT_310797 [Laccaria bicolor S238N-H82]|uniref:Predicted protein n=1 Tax=Laccaria bicolor (strain S238N-H82 / ATCC MYA-4686) TaxID=486041 RepID=B0DV36_LACBS|nr:uncharacterized protein LACBIDRAFT_310797 [Laccaria bicolor S238N-H82]EDR01508.1 predicted protein [Laccaria bicolor S238N-H82]|eukprot:XP_001887860.1 predicted protein [Laccaria bicolor S238N-H82]
MDGSDQGRPLPKPTSCSEPIQRPPGLWFDDGNNVIQAGNYQFRIHRSILSARSPILRRVFSEPTPEGTESIEGCPVTHLQSHGEDVKNFLMAIYDPAFFEPPPKDVPVDVVLSVALLSHKYEVQHLRHRSILHIERNYPMDMDAFIFRWRGARAGQGPWFLGLETLLNIIVTATYINALWVLPAVYYHCSNVTPSHTLRDTSSWNSSQRAIVLRNVLAGTINLEIMDVTYDDLLGTAPCPECLHREKCALDKLARAQEGRLSITQRKPAGRKAHTLAYWWNRKWLKEVYCKGLCTPCSSACMSAYESARGDYWDRIPSAFNLPSWKELKSLRETDLQLNG